jgi:uncharacterized protein
MRLLSLIAVLLASSASYAAEPLKLLFLGDNAGHQPAVRFRLLEPVLAQKGITLTYTDKLEAITLENLNKYDGLVIYANHGKGTREQVKAIQDYVASGKGFIPLHCASYCFIDDAEYVALVGAQFRSHTVGVFRVDNIAPTHPIMVGYQGFESWDETYMHTKHNDKNRTVLEVRTDGDVKEPWTWTRTHGKGRVFYTAWGHDARTWSHQGFHNLVERGIRWACGQQPAIAGAYVDAPKMKAITGDVKDFEMTPAKVPFYPPGKQWGALADPITKMQKPLTPAKSMTHYTMPEGFEMQLFASEEQFGGGKPITMTWDERGRLWVALTYDYPNEMKPEGEGRDKIVILEDTKGTGKADKVTVFAEKLSIPTSLLCVHGGVLVHQAPHTLFLKDTDGDGQADLRQVLYTGWSTGDTHAGPSNLRYGHDNWVYGSVGYSGYVGMIAGEKFNFRQGYYRFKLAAADKGLSVTKFEFLRSTSNNTWGLALNEQGELFGSTANGCVLVHAAIPNRYYEKVRGLSAGVLQPIAMDNRYHPVTDKVRQVDWHGGFTSAAGCAIYTARAYPEEYWNRTAFVSDPTGHLTATFVLQPNGTEYLAHYGWNLVAAQDEWAAPIEAHVGPDGMMWVLDWYNYIVQHNPTPQGFTNGKGNAYETPLRDKKYGRVYRVVYTKAKPEKQPNLKDASVEQLNATLKHSNMFWRLTAQRLLAEQGKISTDERSSDLKGLQSTDPKVQLRTLLAIADEQPSDKFGAVLTELLAKLNPTTEKNLQDATIIASVSQATAVLKSLGKPEKWTKEGIAALELVATNYAAKDGQDIKSILIQYADAKSQVLEPLARGLAAGWPASRKPKADDLPAIREQLSLLLGNSSPTTRVALLKLARTWELPGLDAQLGELAKAFLATALDAKASDAARIEAVKQVLEFRGDDDATISQLLELLSGKNSPQLVNAILDSLSVSRSKIIGPALVAQLSKLPNLSRTAALRLILGRPESARAFLDAVEKGTLRFDMLALDQKTALAANPDKSVAERAKKLLAMGGGLPDADRQKVIDSLHGILSKTGDVANGKKLFVQHCAKCHKHGGEGQQIGPDLTGFAVHPKEEILIHIIDPSRSVEGNYRTYTAKLLDGRIVIGLLAAESRTTVELLDAENKRFPINRDDLEEFKESPKSLMPEGFEKQMKPEELTDLLEFMTRKGKYVPVPLDKFATIVSTKGMFFDDAGEAERLIFKDWKPKTFNGVPFVLTDPQGDKIKNVIMLNGPNGVKAPTMPKNVAIPANTKVAAVHLLSGVGGWNFPATPRGSTSMIVRFHYANGSKEDVELKNGVHFADYIRKVEVTGSQYAFNLSGRQIRYLSVKPKKSDVITQIEFVKGKDESAPVVMAVTIETP